MNPFEFKSFVIKEAKKHMLDTNLDEVEKILSQSEAPKLSKPSFTKNEVNKVSKPPILKASKTPQAAQINESSLLAEEVSVDKIKVLVEEMKKINKKIDLRNPLMNPDLFNIIFETEITNVKNSKRWKDLYNYDIPKDDLR